MDIKISADFFFNVFMLRQYLLKGFKGLLCGMTPYWNI